jgi:hypothetical protein
MLTELANGVLMLTSVLIGLSAVVPFCWVFAALKDVVQDELKGHVERKLK